MLLRDPYILLYHYHQNVPCNLWSTFCIWNKKLSKNDRNWGKSKNIRDLINFGSNIDLREIDFLSVEKISECSRFVNKYVYFSQVDVIIKFLKSMTFNYLHGMLYWISSAWHICLQSRSVHLFFRTWKIYFSQVDVINKFTNSMIFIQENKKIVIKKIFWWCLYRYYSMILSRCFFLFLSFFSNWVYKLILWCIITHTHNTMYTHITPRRMKKAMLMMKLERFKKWYMLTL